MDNEKTKEILDEVDELIQEAEAGGELSSDDIQEILDEISSDLEETTKADKKKTSKELNVKLDKLIEVTRDSLDISSGKSQEIVDAISRIKTEVQAPMVTVEPPEVNVPPIVIPEIKLPKITIPEIKIPDVIVKMPTEMGIKKPTWLASIIDLTPITDRLESLIGQLALFVLPKTASNPISVRLSDGEKFYKAIGGAIAAAAGAVFPFKKSDNSQSAALVDNDGKLYTNATTDPRYAINNISDATTTNMTYICKEDATGAWYIMRIDETGSEPVFRYATVLNNPTLTTYALAFAARTTATYSTKEVAF